MGRYAKPRSTDLCSINAAIEGIEGAEMSVSDVIGDARASRVPVEANLWECGGRSPLDREQRFRTVRAHRIFLK
jgi:hypothetical protein